MFVRQWMSVHHFSFIIFIKSGTKTSHIFFYDFDDDGWEEDDDDDDFDDDDDDDL